MLDICVNQAAGLAAMKPQALPRLVAVTSHGEQRGEMPLLWGLCRHWVDMDQPVIVLDGHSQESEHNPGLLDLLRTTQTATWNASEPRTWTVLPAAHGFDRLIDSGPVQQKLGQLFPDYGVVLVYAPAAQLGKLLQGSNLSPLLVLPPLKSASLTAYQAIKHLLQRAQLRPTVASIYLNSQEHTSNHTPLQNLQSCSQTYLGLSIHPIGVAATASAEQSNEEINRLALQLLENAVMLERHAVERMH